MLLPYGTDAHVYHYPVATISIIATNTVLFLLTGMGDYGNRFVVRVWLQTFEVKCSYRSERGYASRLATKSRGLVTSSTTLKASP